MKIENLLIKSTVFEKKDFNCLHLQVYAKLSDDYVILSRNEHRYICHIKRDEYWVIGIYDKHNSQGQEEKSEGSNTAFLESRNTKGEGNKHEYKPKRVDNHPDALRGYKHIENHDPPFYDGDAFDMLEKMRESGL